MVFLLFATVRPGIDTPTAEADLGAPGGISALPSAAPGFPGIANQAIPAIIPATEPGRGASNKALVSVFCDNAGALPITTTVCADPITFEMTQVYGDGTLASSFDASGGDTLACTDDSACDLADPPEVFGVDGDDDGLCELLPPPAVPGTMETCGVDGVVSVLVNGGGENEIIEVTATDDVGESRTVQIVVVDTILAWDESGAVSTASQQSPAFISYACDDTGLRSLTPLEMLADPDQDGAAGLDDIFDLVFAWGYADAGDNTGLAALTNNFALDVDINLLQCGGDTGSLFDDFVDFQTDLGMFSVDPVAASIEQGIIDLYLAMVAIPPPSLDFDCGEGKNIDTFDISSLAVWGIFLGASQSESGCDVDFAGNGVVTTMLLGTGEVGEATIIGQQGGGVSPPRMINVTLVPVKVGGSAEFPYASEASTAESDLQTEDSGRSAWSYAGLATGLAAAAVALIAGGWYVRRRSAK